MTNTPYIHVDYQHTIDDKTSIQEKIKKLLIYYTHLTEEHKKHIVIDLYS